jgi:hypothetical protein
MVKRMTRVAAAISLMIAQLAGPLLCCCASPRRAAPSAPLTAAHQEPAAPCPACCAHHTPRGGKPAPITPPAPDQPACPCHHDPARSAVTPSDSDPARQTQLGRLAYDAPIALDLSPPEHRLRLSGIAAAVPERSVPFLSVDDLLYGQHILRC